MSDRILAGVMLLFSLYYGFEAYTLQVPFAYDPLGPRAFPFLLSILLAVFVLLVFLSPKEQPRHWPTKRLLLKSVLVVATLVGYSITLFWLGFVLSTIICVTLLALLFEANWGQSLVGGISLGLTFYGLFGWLLQIPLPSPSW